MFGAPRKNISLIRGTARIFQVFTVPCTKKVCLAMRYTIAIERMCDVDDEGEMTSRKLDAMCREFSFH